MSNRRSFISTTAYAALAAGLGTGLSNIALADNYLRPVNNIAVGREDVKLYTELLTQWCHTMVNLQIGDQKFGAAKGGIMCPSCSIVHGRSGDGLYPLLWMAQHTSNRKYYNAAISLYNWMERNVSMADGSWVNDININPWKGITVFTAVALGEALKHHGHLLDAKTRDAWMLRLRRACNFLHDFITIDLSNINYPLCSSYAFALGGTLLNEPRFIKKGQEFAHKALAYITKDGFIYGECKPKTQSPKGCWPVDLSYNVEETLPNLTAYGLLMKDEQLLDAIAASWKAHLEFMLSDGAWDDSFGTRDYKWSYWGSRNSDGCTAGLALLEYKDPIFAEAAYRNALVLKQCTFNGILYGGPHYVSHGEQPCVHHAISHAKSLATVLNEKELLKSEFQRTRLPREQAYGHKKFADIDTHTVAIGDWRATITGNDCEYPESPHASGGCIGLLWHEKAGLLLTDSLVPELKLRETANMQSNRDKVQMQLTPRLEAVAGEKKYTNNRDGKARLSGSGTPAKATVSAMCKLLAHDLSEPSPGASAFVITYTFKPDGLTIDVTGKASEVYTDLCFVLPIVSPKHEKVNLMNLNRVSIAKEKGVLHIVTNGAVTIEQSDKPRVFSHSPGVEAIPLRIQWNNYKIKQLNISITYTS
jgi:hypothetical protein